MLEYIIFKDGDLWCAVTNEFTEAGYGLTPIVALQELLQQIEDNKHYKQQEDTYQ